MKTLRPGEIRFLARQVDKLWRVYDRARGSYPYSHPDLGGTVQQDVDKETAEAEAERLNKKFVKAAPPAKKSQPKIDTEEPEKMRAKRAPKLEREEPSIEPETVEEVDIPDLADYGVLSEEEAAKYEEGLMEKVVY